MNKHRNMFQTKEQDETIEVDQNEMKTHMESK